MRSRARIAVPLWTPRPGSYSDGPAFPQLVREDAFEADAADAFAHISACGSRSNVRQEMEEAWRSRSAEAVPLSRSRASWKGPLEFRIKSEFSLATCEAWGGGGSAYLPAVTPCRKRSREGRA